MLLWFGWVFFLSFVGKKGKRGFLEYLCIKIWVGIKRTSYHLCKYLFSVNKWVNLLLLGEMSLPRNSLEESGWVSYVQPWFRSACNRREVSQVDCVRVGPLQDSGQVPWGAFPAEGAAWAKAGRLTSYSLTCTERLKGGAYLCLTRILPNPWYSDPQQRVDV